LGVLTARATRWGDASVQELPDEVVARRLDRPCASANLVEHETREPPGG
jgi:hypothetical protein